MQAMQCHLSSRSIATSPACPTTQRHGRLGCSLRSQPKSSCTSHLNSSCPCCGCSWLDVQCSTSAAVSMSVQHRRQRHRPVSSQLNASRGGNHTSTRNSKAQPFRLEQLIVVSAAASTGVSSSAQSGALASIPSPTPNTVRPPLSTHSPLAASAQQNAAPGITSLSSGIAEGAHRSNNAGSRSRSNSGVAQNSRVTIELAPRPAHPTSRTPSNSGSTTASSGAASILARSSTANRSSPPTPSQPRATPQSPRAPPSTSSTPDPPAWPATLPAIAAPQPTAAFPPLPEELLEQPPETGVLPDEALHRGTGTPRPSTSTPNSAPGVHTAGGLPKPFSPAPSFKSFSYNADERDQIKESWQTLMRWSKVFRTRQSSTISPMEATNKVVVFGGGSFGTAMGASLAGQKPELEVVLLLRDPYLCRDINTLHCNTKYLKDFTLPPNVRATTAAAEAIAGASFAVHAVPVQSSRAFLVSVRDLLPAHVPIICVSKGLEVGTGLMMSEVIPSALDRKQPCVFLSGPSFAREVMQARPTGVVAACKDAELARTVQALFASPCMRVNTTSDVVGVEICGALKNVLAIAAGIVEGLGLGHNALAALIAQGCSEIRWLAEKLGAKPTTIGGLSGLGDIMLTCYGDLSRNRSVGVRLGQGERLADIIASSSQVAEGVSTAGVVVGLARKYRVSLPVLTAVAQVLDNNLTPSEAVDHIMNLPQIEER